MPGAATLGQRLIYENAKELLDENGVNVKTAILTQSYLRLEQLMTTTATNTLFPILINAGGANAGAPFPTERRLNLQDSFVASEIGVFLFPAATAADTTKQLRSYPSFFTFTAPANTNAQTLYHGYLTLSVNNQVLVPFWDLYRSYLVNQTQNLAALAAASPDDQLSGRDDVFFPTEPNWIIIGSKNNALTLVLPNSFATVLAGSPRIVIYLRGVLAQNSTSVQ